MLASALRFFLLVEAGLFVAAGRALAHLSWGEAAGCAVALMLGFRIGTVGFTYAYAVAHSPGMPRIPPLSALRMVLAECGAFLWLFLIIQPFEQLWMGRDRTPRGRPLVLLVHGYGCNRGAWWWLRRRLEAAGYATATINLEPPYADIAHFVTQLNRRIEDVCTAAGCERVMLVGHSMGGLVARAYLARFGKRRVARLVTLATPHAGSTLARLGLGENARQMEPNSVWLKSLWRDRPDVPMVSLRNSHDNFVVPQDSQRYPAARDVDLPALGHLAMLLSPRAAAALLAALEDRGMQDYTGAVG